MSDKHTPGPWHEGSHRSIESQSGTICEVYSHMGIAEADANQKLIAAAPDLLAVAIEVERLLAAQKFRPEGIGAENKLLAAARAAITKATGGAA